MAISLTPAALERARKFVETSDGAVGLRFGVERTGCSGWGYAVDVAQAVADDDQVFEFQGLKVVVDPKSLPLVDGTEIDFVRKGLNHQFMFRNPNAAAACGCGESFTTSGELAPL